VSRILFISDLHYTARPHERDQGEWLLSIVDYLNPDILISAGDWDELADENYLRNLVQRVPVLTIFGNHENLEALKSVNNPLLNGIGILMPDFTPMNFKDSFGFTILGVNGIWSGRKRRRKGIPRKKGKEFLNLAIEFCEKYSPKPFDIDILVVHDVPDIPEYSGSITLHAGTSLIKEMINLIKPKLVLNGHLHLTEYTFTKLEYGGYYLRVDSSKKHRGFAVIDWSETVKITVYKESAEEKIFSEEFILQFRGDEFIPL